MLESLRASSCAPSFKNCHEEWGNKHSVSINASSIRCHDIVLMNLAVWAISTWHARHDRRIENSHDGATVRGLYSHLRALGILYVQIREDRCYSHGNNHIHQSALTTVVKKVIISLSIVPRRERLMWFYSLTSFLSSNIHPPKMKLHKILNVFKAPILYKRNMNSSPVHALGFILWG